MYEMFVGPIEHEIDHLCRVKHCASPAHLEDVTPEENKARAVYFRPSTVITHCKRGHELNADNARTEYRSKSTARVCRICDNENARRTYRERMERQGKAVGKVKTHCPQGHPYSGENLYINPNGNRVCRECARAATMRWYRSQGRGQGQEAG